MIKIKTDFKQFHAYAKKLRKAADELKSREIFAQWLEECGEDFLKLVVAEIKERNTILDGDLLASFNLGDGKNVFVLDKKGLRLEIGTSINYASFVNDGHRTCKEGVAGRFVPGYWWGDRFIYDPGALTGMWLKQQWVNAKPFFTAAENSMKRIMPTLIESKMRAWLQKTLG